MLQSSQVKQLCKVQVTTQTVVMKVHGNDAAYSAVTGDTFLDATGTEKNIPRSQMSYRITKTAFKCQERLDILIQTIIDFAKNGSEDAGND